MKSLNFFFLQAHQERITVLETEYSNKEMKLQEQVRLLFVVKVTQLDSSHSPDLS